MRIFIFTLNQPKHLRSFFNSFEEIRYFEYLDHKNIVLPQDIKKNSVHVLTTCKQNIICDYFNFGSLADETVCSVMPQSLMCLLSCGDAEHEIPVIA